ncbi:polyphosphate kinase 1 [Gordonibacter sp. 28C]|uniref:polyphosphate kinase 1 n=1 Tax=Gordonibacter sp. 28C TaxID=2078569 RepID=UPI000DF77F4F|nr:polyphosphate kinase 1 [Gordonibacter sp. 28C]RDB62606.1 polyphosphate kinase 1 [Gordonibacter sp. 28C]
MDAVKDLPSPENAADATDAAPQKAAPYLQNRELSWLTFNERVLDQGADETVPLLERLNFVSIFWSNLQEFFMVRVGSLTDLSLVKKHIVDSKSGMTPTEQLDAIYARCHELYPIQERTFEEVRRLLGEHGVHHLRPDELDEEQRVYLSSYVHNNVVPFLSPQIINSRHPFPHLENGALYVVVRLNDEIEQKRKDAAKAEKVEKVEKTDKTAVKEAKKAKNLGAEGVTLGLVPMPRQCERVIVLPGKGLQFILLEHAIEMVSAEIFSMYTVKHTNVVCVTRNADLDATEGTDESDEDYREHMKRILKKRSRLAPVRLESERPLSSTVGKLLMARLSLKPHQIYATPVPLDMSYTYSLASRLPEKERAALTNPPFSPQWPACLDRNRSIIEQVTEKETLLSYPYETMDAFVQLLREAAHDPAVISIKITLYRLASQSHLAEALIAAAENGKEVTALFELRARFDESNNIEWSQRFEQAGCNVIYGFRDFKVHSKICCITRQTDHGLQHITQLGTGNYNEKTAKLYTDLSFVTCDATFGRDAVEFFRNMGLENTSDNYDIMWVAPLQIKPMILAGIDTQIEHARAGEPCGLFFKTNSITDKDVIEKIVEASQAGVPVMLFVRGISCIVPGLEGCTENVRVVSIVGRLLEHSRIYGFGPRETMKLYLSSADLMTRNMDKRIEIAWPILNDELREQILGYLDVSLNDTSKLRELLPDKSYTPLGAFARKDGEGDTVLFDSQEYFIKQAQERRLAAAEEEAARTANRVRAAREETSATATEVVQEAAAAVAAVEATAEAAVQAVTTAVGAPERKAPTTRAIAVSPASHERSRKPSLLVRILSKFVR